MDISIPSMHLVKRDIGTIDQNLLAQDQISLIYQKIQGSFKELSIIFSVGSEKQIGATTLVDNIRLRRAEGVNCYAFAIGKVPKSKQNPKDPVPGSNLVEHIRKKLIDFILLKLPPGFPLKKGKSKLSCTQLKEIFGFIEYLSANFGSQEFLIFIQQLILQNTDFQKFLNIYFGIEDFTQPIPDHFMSELKFLLLDEYKVYPDKMIPSIVSKLLELDGLIKIDSHNSEILQKDHGFGSTLIAAFCREGDDYHFVRLMDNGWYERHGDLIQKRINAPDGILIGKTEEIQAVFYPGYEKDFIGYFIVPTTITAVDGIGRDFLFESHKS